ncbi:quinone-dependent dihydroorotate dehydrogenase [bacterium]|jgi:dihydroorotate dehydrogenase|nr:quinone-dependent dihydroorotate dehydrogenase [bacterium]
MRELIWKCVRWFLFRLDAETAHRLTFSLVRLGAVGGGGLLRIVSGAPSRSKEPLSEVWGQKFLSQVGLAAGFDKDAEILEALPSLGFGFAELGTVTPRPQPGNPRPRLFRDFQSRAVFNRMGFNGLGAEVVSRRLEKALANLPENFRVGVNLGKNKDTPLEEAAADYRLAASKFEGLADYLVINVSSPNTPGLRSLQSVESLRPLVEAVAEKTAGWKRTPPILLKLAPEIRGAELKEILENGPKWGLKGWVLTNTLAGTRGDQSGGWSGSSLTKLSLDVLREARSQTSLPIVSVGGIMSAQDAWNRIQAGANLVQIYSGWVFKGPHFPGEIQRFFELQKHESPRSTNRT